MEITTIEDWIRESHEKCNLKAKNNENRLIAKMFLQNKNTTKLRYWNIKAENLEYTQTTV